MKQVDVKIRGRLAYRVPTFFLGEMGVEENIRRVAIEVRRQVRVIEGHLDIVVQAAAFEQMCQ